MTKRNGAFYQQLVLCRFPEHYAVSFAFIGKLFKVVNHPCELY